MDNHGRQTHLHSLIKQIYTIVAAQNAWNDVLTSINAFFNSHASGLFLQNPNGTLEKAMLPGISSGYFKSYDEHYGAINPWFTHPGLMTPGRVLTDQTFHEQLQYSKGYFHESEFYQDWFRPQKFDHAIGGQLTAISGSSLNFSLMRERAAGCYKKAEIDAYGILSRHIINALSLAKSVSILHLAFSSNALAFELNNQGYGILDMNAAIQQSNGLLLPMLRSIEGCRVQDNRISFLSEDIANDFFGALRRALKFNLPVSATYLHSGEVVNIQFIPPTSVDSLFNESAKLVTVIVQTNSRAQTRTMRLSRTHYEFTQKEQSLLRHMLAGRTLKEASVRLGISYETSRWHLRNIMKKVGVKSQNALICRLTDDLRNSEKNVFSNG